MIQEIEDFRAELERLALLRHAEILVRGKVPSEAARSDHRIPASITEMVDLLQREGVRVEPAVCRWIVERFALPCGIGTIVGNVRVRAIRPGAWIDRKSGAPGDDGADLPSA